MRILSCQVTNFASYSALEFNFENQGLSLISGATGSGKSTLCDVIPWILFGVTAKGGAVDEVRSWTSNSPTTGRISLEFAHNRLDIYRVRGSSKDNDLYYIYDDSEPTRGKDLKDTQNLINNIPGFTADLYLSGAYLHEFSQTAGFFTAPAKARRQLTEQLVDLSLAKNLAEQAKIYKKSVLDELTSLEQELLIKSNKLEYTETALESEITKSAEWEAKRLKRVKDLEDKRDNFKSEQNDIISTLKQEAVRLEAEAKIDIEEIQRSAKLDSYFTYIFAELEKKEVELGDASCPTCGALKDTFERLKLTKARHVLELERASNTADLNREKTLYTSFIHATQKLTARIDKENERTNPYLEQIKEVRKEQNPYDAKASLKEVVATLQQEITTLNKDIDSFKVEVADIELLSDITDEFRGVLVKNTIIELETRTNQILTDHFDGEFRVNFDISESDKLEVTILKDGNKAVFTQLSKGQRQLLKLSFGLSVMKCVANHHGVKFSTVFLDEAFDGLDESLKVKAHGLLQSLESEYESIFVCEHSLELKTRFNKQFHVELVNGESSVCLL